MLDSEDSCATLKDRAKRNLDRDMGPLLINALNDPHTVELMVNADGRVWHEKLGETMACIGDLRPAQAEAIIKTVAGYHSKEVTKLKPIIEGEFPLDGSRFAGQLPPIVSSPTFAIRKKAVARFTLEQYVEQRMMTSLNERLRSVLNMHGLHCGALIDESGAVVMRVGDFQSYGDEGLDPTGDVQVMPDE